MGKRKKPGPEKGSDSPNPDGRPPLKPSVRRRHKVFVRLNDEEKGTLDQLSVKLAADTSDTIRRSIDETAERHGVKGKAN